MRHESSNSLAPDNFNYSDGFLLVSNNFTIYICI